MKKKGHTLTYYRVLYNGFLKDLDLLEKIGKNNIRTEKDKIHIFCSEDWKSELLMEKFGKPLNQRRT